MFILIEQERQRMNSIVARFKEVQSLYFIILVVSAAYNIKPIVTELNMNIYHSFLKITLVCSHKTPSKFPSGDD